MSEVCPKCGLPKELCVCETIAKEDQKIIIKVIKRKFGKIITLVGGIDEKAINLKDLAKSLKSKLACGGTSKEGTIELQGSHGSKVREELIKLGFAPDTIEIEK
ncbi:stress response translation initiation inhibitor YciH [Candidatus Woesearchaeota archaeon]|nr:stress response translation initiation inhibitor YciH [Candidatus Woesearchaeota archaeon]